MSSALLNINGEVKNYRIGDGLKDSDYILVAVDWNSVIIADANDKETIISMPDAIDTRIKDKVLISDGCHFIDKSFDIGIL